MDKARDIFESLFSESDDEIAQRRRMPYNYYLQTAYWRAKHWAAIIRAGYRCQVCNGEEDLHVHHRDYERRGSEDDADLTVLCKRCHALFHAYVPNFPYPYPSP